MANLCIIPARGGSKRIPKKNIKNFLGKPIIAYSIEAALNSGIFDEIIVSTDDIEIAEIAKRYGAKVPFMRSVEASNDFATTFDVIEEVLLRYGEQGKTFNATCCIYACAPFVTPEKLIEGYQILSENNFDSVIPMMSFSYPIQRAFKINSNNKINFLNPEFALSRSQDIENYYHDAGQFYWFKPIKCLKYKSLFTNNSGSIIISELEGQDIDNLTDWELAEIKFKFLQKAKNDQILSVTDNKSENRLIIGTAQMGLKNYGINNFTGKISFNVCCDILKKAYELGIRSIDTAEVYGNAHKIIGNFHRRNPDIRFKVITKIPSDFGNKNIENKIYKYLKVLQINFIEVIMFHSLESYKNCCNNKIEALLRLKKQGVVNHIGVSVYTNSELAELITEDDITVVQMPYNLLDNQSVRGNMMTILKNNNKKIVSRSTFLQGLFFNLNNDKIKQSLNKELNFIHEIAKEEQISISSLALNYCLNQENIDQVIIGVESIEQLIEDVKGIQSNFDSKIIAKVNDIKVINPDLLNPTLWN